MNSCVLYRFTYSHNEDATISTGQPSSIDTILLQGCLILLITVHQRAQLYNNKPQIIESMSRQTINNVGII